MPTPSQSVPFSSCLHWEAMNQFTTRSPVSDERLCLEWICLSASLPDDGQVTDVGGPRTSLLGSSCNGPWRLLCHEKNARGHGDNPG